MEKEKSLDCVQSMTKEEIYYGFLLLLVYLLVSISAVVYLEETARHSKLWAPFSSFPQQRTNFCLGWDNSTHRPVVHDSREGRKGSWGSAAMRFW